MNCTRCEKPLNCDQACSHPAGPLCEDCYIDLAAPAVGKMMYESDPARFMLRLKDSYIACPQRYH